MQQHPLVPHKPFHRLQILLIVLAILVTQFAGLVHGIEHVPQAVAKTADPHSHDWHGSAASKDILHSCLLFDGIATAQALLPLLSPALFKPVLAQLGLHEFEISKRIDSVFALRARVRDPPVFS